MLSIEMTSLDLLLLIAIGSVSDRMRLKQGEILISTMQADIYQVR